jgi:diadenosine tetraphosphate (Ap4A) HIT family hydrolase
MVEQDSRLKWRVDPGHVEDCLACDLAAGRIPLPGGTIHETPHWLVEHCVGPLGTGTIIVKPKRHVTRVSDLNEAEAQELGPLLRQAAIVVDDLLSPEQVYECLWSHSGGRPVHIHYVVQPVTATLLATIGARGPNLQAAMFERNGALSLSEVEAFAVRARAAFLLITE